VYFFLKKKELQIIERERKTNTNRQSIGFQMMKDKIRKKLMNKKK
jgi:CHASE1-domain containing sensor protein